MKLGSVWNTRRLGLALGWVMVAGIAAGAEPPNAFTSADPALLIRDLDSDVFEIRSVAHQKLLNSGDVTERDLAELVRAGSLTPEQNRRIVAILRDRFMMGPRGAIGIQFATVNDPQRPTLVQNVLPGFPAGAQKLVRVGDEIIAVDGVDLTRFNARERVTTLQRATFSRAPGQMLPVVIRRPRPGVGPDQPAPFEEIAVAIPLGDSSNFNRTRQPAANLQQRNGLTVQALFPIWRARAEELGIDGVALLAAPDELRNAGARRPIDAGVSPPGSARVFEGPVPVVESPVGQLPSGQELVFNEQMLEVMANRQPRGMVQRMGANVNARGAVVRGDARVRLINQPAQRVHPDRIRMFKPGETLIPGSAEAGGAATVEDISRAAGRLAALRTALEALTRRMSGLGGAESVSIREAGKAQAASLRAEIAALSARLDATINVPEPDPE